GAGPRQAPRRAHRPVLVRRRALRNGHRQAAVSRRELGGDLRFHSQPRSRAAGPAESGFTGGRVAHHRQMPGERSQLALSERLGNSRRSPTLEPRHWSRNRPRERSKAIFPAAAAALALVAAGAYFYSHRTAKLTDKDTIVLADFSNTTGDPVF